MGVFDKLIDGLNRVDRAKTNAEFAVFGDHRFAQADRLQAEGITTEGVITGVHRYLNDGDSRSVLRIEWFAPQPTAAAVILGTDGTDHARLGCTVALRHDDENAVLDWALMAPIWGQREPVQRRNRKVPEQGLIDTGLDARVLSRLKKWTPTRATIASFTRRSSPFGLTENYDIVVTHADGSTARTKGDEVPFYARWLIRPGVDVPVVVDPKDVTTVQIDWARLGSEHATEGGTWRDAPPPGSIVAQREAGA